MYTSSMRQEEIQRLVNVTGFKVGSFPFKYLGVPISFKTISRKDCMTLVENNTAIIRSWRSKKLAYRARVDWCW